MEKLNTKINTFGNIYIRMLLSDEILRLENELTNGKKCCPECEQSLIDTISNVENVLEEMGGKYVGETYIKIGHEFFLKGDEA